MTQEAKKMKIVYIAHPIGGDIEANLASIRRIVHKINTDPKYATVLPFVPYYADVVSMDDNNPEQREIGIKNGLYILSKSDFVNEVWLFGNTITPGMRREVFTAFSYKIKVCAVNDTIYRELLTLKDEWEKQ